MSGDKEVVDSFYKAVLGRPWDFEFSPYEVLDRESGYAFWIGNGVFFYGVHKPYSARFNLIQQFRFKAALGVLRAKHAEHHLGLTATR